MEAVDAHNEGLVAQRSVEGLQTGGRNEVIRIRIKLMRICNPAVVKKCQKM
jgi:hypothetical protein